MKLKKYKLGDIGEIRMCKRILKSQTTTKGDIPFYKIGTFGKEADTFISRKIFNSYKERYNFPNKGDVLISAAGTIGRCVIYNGEDSYYQDSNIVWVNNDESIVLNDYLFYVLNNITWIPSKGSTILRLYNDDIRNKDFIVPNLEYQRVIADTLKAIDKKIKLNRQINDNLEAMAKQLYDYWFVQFDFPNEEGKPYKSSGGAMLWNEKLKREIPLGWSVLSVNDIAASVRGVSYAKDDMVDSNNGVLVLRGNNIQDNRLIYDSNVAYIPSSFVSENQRIRPLDIIMTMSSGSKEHIGKSAMFQFASEDTFGAFLTKFTAKEHCAYLLFNLFNSKYFKAKIKSIACGTGINNLTNQTFDEIYVVMPEDELLLEFDKRQSQIFAEIGLSNVQKITSAENLRSRASDEIVPFREFIIKDDTSALL